MNSVEANEEHTESSMSQNTAIKTVVPRYAWVILVVAFIASFAAPLAMFKVSPVLPVLIEKYHLNLTTAGALISLFAVTGFILALPAGMILHKLGLKVTGLIAMGCLVIGSMWGAYSATSVSLLASRFVEGAGMGLIAVAAPAALAMWFPAEKRGLAMGIWNNWMPVGCLVVFALAPTLAIRFGYQSVWWFSGAVAFLAFVLVAIFMRMPSAAEIGQSAGGPPPSGERVSMRQALANRNIWLLWICAAIFGIGAMIIPTFYVTFLTEVHGYNMQNAAFFLTFSQIIAMIAAPAAGVLLDRVRSRKTLFTWPFIALAVIFLFPFNITGGLIWIWVAVYAIFAALIPTAIFTVAPEVMGDLRLAGIGMGMVSMGQNFGMFIGPMLFGALAQSYGWSAAGYWMLPILVVGALTGLSVKMKKKK